MAVSWLGGPMMVLHVSITTTSGLATLCARAHTAMAYVSRHAVFKNLYHSYRNVVFNEDIAASSLIAHVPVRACADDMSISSTCGEDEIFHDEHMDRSVTNYDMLLYLDSDPGVRKHICSLIGNPSDLNC